MHAHRPQTHARLGRRQMLAGTAGVVAGGALAVSNAQLAFADPEHGSGAVVPPPKPIPGGLQIPGGPFIHVFLPGPSSVTLPFSGSQLMGLNVEPSTITDFSGTTAVAMLVGSATGGADQPRPHLGIPPVARQATERNRASLGISVVVSPARRGGQLGLAADTRN